MSYHRVRTLARKVKLYRDLITDNSLIIDDAENDFLQILHLIFDNAREQNNTENTPTKPNHENDTSETSSGSNDETRKEENSESQRSTDTFETANTVTLEKDYRKLYREIIKKVHPDRYAALHIKTRHQIKRAEKIFQNAKNFAECNNVQGIIEICAQLEIDISHLSEESTENCLKDAGEKLPQIIQEQEKTLQMMWHYNENNLDIKVKIVMLYIDRVGKRGKNITETLVKDVVASYNKDGTRKKRKVGQRPAKLKR